MYMPDHLMDMLSQEGSHAVLLMLMWASYYEIHLFDLDGDLETLDWYSMDQQH